MSAELISFQIAEERNEDAKNADVMLMPGCGGSGAVLGCLAGHVIEHVEKPVSIDVALHIAGSVSRGTATTAAENLTPTPFQRRNGELVLDDPERTAQFDFDDQMGMISCIPLPLPDLMTLWKLTKIPNIRTFIHPSAGRNTFPNEGYAELPEGPTEEHMDSHPYDGSIVVTSSDGSVVRGVVHTVNGYQFTPAASVEAARRVLSGGFQPGYQVAASLFGKNFIASAVPAEFKIL